MPGATKMSCHPPTARSYRGGAADQWDSRHGELGRLRFFDVATQPPIANQNLIHSIHGSGPHDILEADGSDTCIVALAQMGAAYALVESTISADRPTGH